MNALPDCSALSSIWCLEPNRSTAKPRRHDHHRRGCSTLLPEPGKILKGVTARVSWLVWFSVPSISGSFSVHLGPEP
jgi:hypothetical protein